MSLNTASRRQRSASKNISLSTLLDASESSADQLLSAVDAGTRSTIAQELKEALLQIYRLGHSSQLRKIESIVSFAREQRKHLSAHEFFIILAEAANCYEIFEDSTRAILLVSEALSMPEEELTPNLIRKAHNILGVCHAHLLRFDISCEHFTKALTMAPSQHDDVGRFAVLVNIVALFESMGLISDAKLMSLEMLKFSADDPLFRLFYFQNTINGAFLSRTQGDRDLFHRFHKISKMQIGSIENLPDEWLVQYEANHTIYLIELGQAKSAKEYIASCIDRRTVCGIRTPAVLFCAEALCNSAIGDRRGIVSSRRKLRKLIANIKDTSLHYEEVMKVIVRLYDRGKERERRIGLALLRRLREYYVSVKHRQFFAKTLVANNAALSNRHLSEPIYKTPQNANVIIDRDGHISAFEDNRTSYGNVELEAVGVELARLESGDNGCIRRSADYNIAENWVVAAELAAGQTGLHCFHVGRFAGLIAFEMGWSEDACSTLELACRLHDIGDIAIDREILRRSERGEIDGYSRLQEHTIAGEQILSGSADELLQLGSRIAYGHHEWWNGAGCPCGRVGDETPIEARICAVADAFYSLIEPGGAGSSWNVIAAKRQVLTMFGSQLDPGLMTAFANVIEMERVFDDRVLRPIDLGFRDRLFGGASRLTDIINLTKLN
jgi:putative two-component system response regulator